MAKKILPLYSLRINPEKNSVVSAISLVGKPATGSNFIAFSENQQPARVEFRLNEDRMELIGAAMIPGIPMYRNTPPIGEYIAVFEEDSIKQIAQVFAERGFFNNMNLDHSANQADSYVYQSYILDPSQGRNAPEGMDLPVGTWMVGVKVNSPEVWASIKDGTRQGFSVEGFFDLFDTSIDIEFSEEEVSLAVEFESLIMEFAGEGKGCLMFYPEVDRKAWELKARQIAPGAMELELEPHITLLYGFNDAPGTIDTLKAFLSEALNAAPINIELGKISKFIQTDKDVIKIEIMDCNGSLFAINTILSDIFQVISPYGEYKPHMTIAYTQPNPDTVFSNEITWPYEFGINYINRGKIIYSDANNIKTEILTIK